jgi:uncharacterized protein YpiB (UPF0302 family)
MFNYVQFVDKKDGSKNTFDFSAFRAIEVDFIYYEEYMNNPESAVHYLLNNGLMSQDVFNQISQMANQLGLR